MFDSDSVFRVYVYCAFLNIDACAFYIGKLAAYPDEFRRCRLFQSRTFQMMCFARCELCFNVVCLYVLYLDVVVDIFLHVCCRLYTPSTCNELCP